MAYIVDYALTESAAGATSFSANVPAHQADDYLVVSFTTDASYTLGVTGYTAIGASQTANSAVTTHLFYKKAASSSETITCTMNTADAYAVAVICVRDADPATFIDASSRTNSGTTSSSTVTSASVTTTTADCLLLYIVGKDGIANQAHSNPGIHFLISHDSGGSTATTSAAQAIGWYVQRAVGTTPAPTWTSALAGVTTFATVAIRNKSGGVIPAYVDDSELPGTTMIMGHHFSTLNNLTFNGALSIANIGPSASGKATVYDAAAATADYGINPYSAALATTPSATAATSASGFQVTFTNVHDLSTDFIVGTIIAANPKIANYNHGSIAQGGTYVVAADANNYFNSFQVASRDSSPNTEGRMVFSVQPNQSSTRYGYSTNAYVASATKKLLFLSNCPTATITEYFAEIHRARTHIVAGGIESEPVDSEGLAQIGKSFRIPLIQKTGAAGVLSYVPLQIGGGDAVNFQIDAGSLQFPRKFNAASKQINYHAADNAIGIRYAGKSGDVIKHTNSVVTSASPYYWEIHTAATNAATWDFTGLTVVNATTTLRNVMTFSGMTFANCPSLTATGCSISNSVIGIVATTANKLVLNASSSLNACSFNTTGISSGVAMTQVTTPSIFSSCTFTGSASTGHAIEITTAGTYTFSGNIFNGYGAAGSTSAAIYNNSGGSVTLNITGGGSAPTIRNGAGASTTVNANVQITLTGLQNPSEVRVFLAGTATEVLGTGAENVTSGSHSFGVSSGTAVDITILSLGYQNARIKNFSTTADTSVPVSQVLDRQYQNI